MHDGCRSETTVSKRGPERAEIVRERRGIALCALPHRLTAEQHAGLGLVVSRRRGRRQRQADHLAVTVIGLLGADEDADAMLRLRIIIAHGIAGPLRDEAV